MKRRERMVWWSINQLNDVVVIITTRICNRYLKLLLLLGAIEMSTQVVENPSKFVFFEVWFFERELLLLVFIDLNIYANSETCNIYQCVHFNNSFHDYEFSLVMTCYERKWCTCDFIKESPKWSFITCLYLNYWPFSKYMISLSLCEVHMDPLSLSLNWGEMI